jgi:hypothetical protein
MEYTKCRVWAGDKVFWHSYSPPTPREKWLPSAVSDAAFLNTKLFVSALNVCGLKGILSAPTCFILKAKRFVSIKERLGSREMPVARTWLLWNS